MNVEITDWEKENVGMVIESKLIKTKWVLENREVKPESKPKLEENVKNYEDFLNKIGYEKQGKIYFKHNKKYSRTE